MSKKKLSPVVDLMRALCHSGDHAWISTGTTGPKPGTSCCCGKTTWKPEPEPAPPGDAAP